MEQDNIFYSTKYYDDKYEYRHCELRHEGLSYAIINYERDKDSLEEMFLPLVLVRSKGKLLSETQWRSLGITMSMGWQHYLAYKPNPTVLCFRRPIGCDSRTGLAPAEWEPFPGEMNIWRPKPKPKLPSLPVEKDKNDTENPPEKEAFEAGDEIWVKEQLAEPLFTEEDDEGNRVELKEGMRLMVLKVNEDTGDVCIKQETWSEGLWLSSEFIHTLTKYGHGLSRKPAQNRGKKRKVDLEEEVDERSFGKDLNQQVYERFAFLSPPLF